MSSALNIGTTGLSASAQQMDVIGNNLANANTVGFKAAETNFASMLSQSLTSGGGAAAVGQGVSVSAVSTLFGQGTFEATGNVTDMAIDGNGFFITKDILGNTLYTRAGVFHVANDGLLVDLNGYKVQGHTFDSDGVIEAQNLSDLNLQNALSKPSATTYFGVGATLNTETAEGGTFSTSQVVYDSTGAKHDLNTIFTRTTQPGYWAVQVSLDNTTVATDQSYSGVIFDSDGNISTTFKGTATNAAKVSATGTVTALPTLNNGGSIYQDATITLTKTASGWTVASSTGGYQNATAEFSSVTTTNMLVDLDGGIVGSVSGSSADGGADIIISTGGTWSIGDKITFDLDYDVPATHSNPANNDIRFYNGTTNTALPNGATIGTLGVLEWNVIGMTNHEAPSINSFATTSRISRLESDGYAPGLLSALSVSNNGIIEGRFSNGQRQNLARILFADFASLQGLNKAGAYFIETVASGSAVTNAPGAGGLGELRSNSLEMSNTDTAKEFIRMITAQRTYQSSAKIITTADQMLQTLMNVKQ